MCLKELFRKMTEPKPTNPVPPTPPPPPPVNPLTDEISHVTYRVMAIDNIDVPNLKRTLSLIPSFFHFYFDTVEYTVTPDGGFKGFHCPTANFQMIFFNGVKYGFNYGGGCANEGRIGISVDPIYHERYHLAIRTYHELLHGEGLDADGMVRDTPNGAVYNVGFAQWLPDELRAEFVHFFNEPTVRHNPAWQRLYYDYLLLNAQPLATAGMSIKANSDGRYILSR